mgnify:CR=1 FL=1
MKIKEQLINFETAKLAKNKGLDEEYAYIYYDKNKNLIESGINTKLYPDEYLAISQSLLHKWLREEYNIIILIEYNDWVEDDSPAYQKYIYYFIYKNKAYQESYFNSYEDALEAGLQEALKLI